MNSFSFVCLKKYLFLLYFEGLFHGYEILDCGVLSFNNKYFTPPFSCLPGFQWEVHCNCNSYLWSYIDDIFPLPLSKFPLCLWYSAVWIWYAKIQSCFGCGCRGENLSCWVLSEFPGSVFWFLTFGKFLVIIISNISSALYSLSSSGILIMCM